MKLFTRDRGIGSLVPAALHTKREQPKLIVGKSYTIPELIAGNGIKKKKWSLKMLIA